MSSAVARACGVADANCAKAQDAEVALEAVKIGGRSFSKGYRRHVTGPFYYKYARCD